MSEVRVAAPLAKWPFYLADVALSAVLVFVLYRLGPIEGATDVVIATACVFGAGWAAWISILPWLNEHRSQVELSDSANLKSSLEQIQSVEKVADLIRQANSQWQAVQDSAGRTVASAREISDKMKAETDEFMRFLDNANNTERSGLKLEVEKLRRMEGDWIKVTVGIMDHIFAITRAAERSGQSQVTAQLQQFQNACRDVARRIGLAPFVPNLQEPFDPRAHQLPDPKATAPVNARVGDVLATGFTYQGQLLRRALVLLAGDPPVEEMAANQETAAAEPAETPANEEMPITDEAAPEVIEQADPEPAEPKAVVDDFAAMAAREAERRAQSDGDLTETVAAPDSIPEPAPEPIAELAAQDAPPTAKPSRRKRLTGQEQLPLV